MYEIFLFISVNKINLSKIKNTTVCLQKKVLHQKNEIYSVLFVLRKLISLAIGLQLVHKIKIFPFSHIPTSSQHAKYF